jgi:hypothetical protein
MDKEIRKKFLITKIDETQSKIHGLEQLLELAKETLVIRENTKKILMSNQDFLKQEAYIVKLENYKDNVIRLKKLNDDIDEVKNKIIKHQIMILSSKDWLKYYKKELKVLDFELINNSNILD